MKANLQLPRERVCALAPAHVESYLLAHGWKVDPQASSSEAGVYHFPAEPDAEILLPRNKDFIDYALRMSEVLQELADAEHRTAWEVLEHLATAETDSSSNGPVAGQSGTRVKQKRPKTP